MSFRSLKDVHELGIKLKTNTVVTSMNYQETMVPLIGSLAPQRWKILQYLHIQGCNDKHMTELEIRPEQFELFRRNNAGMDLPSGANPIFESNEDMLGSYLMLAPDGQLVLNNGAIYKKVDLGSIGLDDDIGSYVDAKKYQKRGGSYAW